MPKFSLIIPVYNVEQFLAECLDSCINQTFANIEIICIDDSSSDNSRVILAEYAQRDNRIKVITQEKNKGQGAARNAGINVALGDYCWFIDSDDYVLLNACEILNDTLEQFDADIIRFNRIDYFYDNVTGKKRILPQKLYSWTPPNRMFTKKEYTSLRNPEGSPCMFIASTKLLKTVKFREGVIYEDADYTPILFSKSEKIYYINYSLYCVRQRMGSTTRNTLDDLTGKRIINILLAANALYEYIGLTKLQKRHFCTRAVLSLYSNVHREYAKFSELHTDELNSIIKKIKIFFYKYHFCFKFYDNFIDLFKDTFITKISKKIYLVILRFKKNNTRKNSV
jgi:glycosyltransferase involved in cell wall biosynthesis